MKENTNKQSEIIVTGFGGQGIILAGKILGMAASLGDKKESTLVQAYGPESRGGACNAQVIISDVPIHYPYVKVPDILLAMSQAGYDKFEPLLVEETRLLIDQDLVLNFVDVRDVAVAHFNAGFTPEANGRYIVSAANTSFPEMGRVLVCVCVRS